jgi:Sterol carrier protein domain
MSGDDLFAEVDLGDARFERTLARIRANLDNIDAMLGWHSRADLWIVGSEPAPEPEREESAALAARTYGEAAEGVTIAVTDDLFPANDGVWHVDAKGAVHDEIEPAGADLATDVATLAATYLGGVRWSALADVGDVEVRNDSALAAADTLFLHSPAPFCGSAF